MGKQLYETPEMEMIEISVNDVIATSGPLRPEYAPFDPSIGE